ncbi:MAG TPA: hypothetical protein VFB74_20955 [Kribbellaceae bacterium]|nr:hypothetical protein [Kribbellaceae bacterium]
MASSSGPRPVLPVTTQFAALEPIWAGISSSAQLRALLVLGALFNDRVHVSDTQLIDNPRIIGDFEKRFGQGLNLYTLLTDLIREGIVTVGLRESNYLYREERPDPCTTLADVLRSWKINSPDGEGWVTSPLNETRRRMVAHLDTTLAKSNASVIAYDYMKVKHDFMQQVREESARSGSPLDLLLREQPAELRRRYDDITAQGWFSHTPVYALLREAGLEMKHDLIQIHGIFDETAYARIHQARLLGSDWSEEGEPLAERVLAPKHRTDAGTRALPSEAELVEAAHRLVEAPSPELLAGLSADEILALRAHAREMFEIQSHIEVNSPAEVDTALVRAMVDAAASYWEKVCAHVRSTRPHLALQPTRLGIFLRENLPSVSRIAERFATSGLATIAEVAVNLIPGVSLSTESRQALLRHVSLEFVFFVESDRMRQIRQLYPRRGWIAPDARTL